MTGVLRGASATCPPPSYSAASANARSSADRARALTAESSQITRSGVDERRVTPRGARVPWRSARPQVPASRSTVAVSVSAPRTQASWLPDSSGRSAATSNSLRSSSSFARP